MTQFNSLEEYFAIGRVIYSSYWMKYDKVLSFNRPGINGCNYCDWSVTVIECDVNGNPVNGAKPRTHCTHPDIFKREWEEREVLS